MYNYKIQTRHSNVQLLIHYNYIASRYSLYCSGKFNQPPFVEEKLVLRSVVPYQDNEFSLIRVFVVERTVRNANVHGRAAGRQHRFHRERARYILQSQGEHGIEALEIFETHASVLFSAMCAK